MLLTSVFGSAEIPGLWASPFPARKSWPERLDGEPGPDQEHR